MSEDSWLQFNQNAWKYYQQCNPANHSGPYAPYPPYMGCYPPFSYPPPEIGTQPSNEEHAKSVEKFLQRLSSEAESSRPNLSHSSLNIERPSSSRSNRSSDRPSKSKTRRSVKKDDTLKELHTKHDDICDYFVKNPTQHPQYENEKKNWMKYMKQQKVEFSHSLLEQEWQKFWSKTLEELLEKRWVEEKLNYEKNEDEKRRRKRSPSSSSYSSSSSSSSSSASSSSSSSSKSTKSKRKKKSRKRKRKHEKRSKDKKPDDSKSISKTEEKKETKDENIINDKSAGGMEFIEILSILKQMGTKLDLYEEAVSHLLNQAINAQSKGKNPFDCIDNDAEMLLKIIEQKLEMSGQSSNVSVIQKAICSETTLKLKALIEKVKKYKRTLNIESLADATSGKSVSETVKFIKVVVTNMGLDFSDEKLMELYLSVKSCQAKKVLKCDTDKTANGSVNKLDSTIPPGQISNVKKEQLDSVSPPEENPRVTHPKVEKSFASSSSSTFPAKDSKIIEKRKSSSTEERLKDDNRSSASQRRQSRERYSSSSRPNKSTRRSHSRDRGPKQNTSKRPFSYQHRSETTRTSKHHSHRDSASRYTKHDSPRARNDRYSSSNRFFNNEKNNSGDIKSSKERPHKHFKYEKQPPSKVVMTFKSKRPTSVVDSSGKSVPDVFSANFEDVSD